MKRSENTSVSSSSSLSNQRKSKPSEPKLSQTKPVFKLEQEPYSKFSVIKFTPVLNNINNNNDNNNNRNSRNVTLNNEQDGINDHYIRIGTNNNNNKNTGNISPIPITTIITGEGKQRTSITLHELFN